MPDFLLEQSHGKLIAGVDEAGRGPWAGPVVAAAVVLWRDGKLIPDMPHGLDDSKKLTAAKRETLYAQIVACADVGVGVVDVAIIDEVNILQATKLAMQQAVAQLQVLPEVVLVDGAHAPAFACRAVPIIRGDSKSLSIAAASIVAKVTRDRIMQQLHADFPHYGWNRNAGYGTKLHQEGLSAHGVTPHHRRSFRPIRVLLEQECVNAEL